MAIVTPFELTEPFSTDTFNSRIDEINILQQYWWMRSIPTITTTLGDVEKDTILSGNVLTGRTTNGSVQYSSEINIDPVTLKITLKDPITVTGNYANTYTNFEVLKGKYYLNESPGTDNSGRFNSGYGRKGQIRYVPSDAVVQNKDYGDEDNYNFCIDITKAQSVTANKTWADKVYLQSNNINAYPNGISGEYEYRFIGRPYDLFTDPVKVEIIEYVGTGTYGSSNPNTLTFTNTPEIVFFKTGGSGYGVQTYVWGNTQFAGLVGNSNYYLVASVDEYATMTWYVGGSGSSVATASTQMNVSGKKYKAIAICKNGGAH